jgi:acyl dehydratase
MMPPAPVDLPLHALPEGTRAEHEYVISEACHRALTETFGDVSPVHVDAAFAARAGFPEPVMHGAIINSFLSHFVGMVLPGRRALLLSVDMRYLAPSHLGDRLLIAGEVSQRVESQSTIVLAVRVENLTRSRTVARARIQVRVSDVE